LIYPKGERVSIEASKAEAPDILKEFRLAVKRSPRYRGGIDEWPIPEGRGVILVGEVDKFPEAERDLRRRGISIEAAISSDASDAGNEGTSAPLVRREHYPKTLPSPVVFIGTPRKHHFSSSKLFGRTARWLDASKVPKIRSRLADKHILRAHGIELLEMYNLLQDDDSKASLISIVASRYRNDNGYLRVAKYREYTHPRAKVQRGDVVVDAGAHVGKVSRSFAKACGSEGAVYSFEPDPVNYVALAQHNHDLACVHPIRSGVWDQTTTLSFNNVDGPSAGHALSDNGTIAVPVVSLDDFFSHDGRRAPTVMKFDIEGAEAKALSGAEATIREHKPRLMISAYHKPRDLWELLFQVREMRPDYKFYLGHHNFYHTETDIYAV
jgi:FkbM family methyltransferase